MPKYYGTIELQLEEFEASSPLEALNKIEDYKDIIAQHDEMSWPNWDFTLLPYTEGEDTEGPTPSRRYEEAIADVLNSIAEMRESGDYDEDTLEGLEWRISPPARER
jgi:plasmid stabilization system protein ParE